MVLYLDAVWLLNLFIDACLLKLSAVMLKRRLSHLRLWLGALLASTIVLLMFTPLSAVVSHPAGKLIFSALIILVAFGYGRLSVFLQNLAAFYFTAFAIGGGLFATHYFILNEPFYAEGLTNISFGDPISWIMVIVGFPLLWLFSKRRMQQTAVRKWQSAFGAEVTIHVFDRTICAKGMIDSGNKLYEPLTRTPVMFLSRQACGDQLPDAFFSADHGAQLLAENASFSSEWTGRLTLIPYRSVDGAPRLITAFRPDRVLIFHEGKRIECKKVYVALTEHELNAAGDFNSILHPDMLIHGKLVESAS